MLGSQVCLTVLAVDRFPKYLTGALQRQQEAGSFSARQRKLLLHRAETLDAAWVGVGGGWRRRVSVPRGLWTAAKLTRQGEGARFIGL